MHKFPVVPVIIACLLTTASAFVDQSAVRTKFRPATSLLPVVDCAMPAKQVPLIAWLKQGGAMWTSAALLGPLCDGCHSSHDVLHYAHDSLAGPPWLFYAPGGGDHVLLETCWWVPLAFGGAGVILGAAHPILDRKWDKERRDPPGWPLVLLSVACFVGCYELSGVLAQAAAERGVHEWPSLDAPLFAIALVMFLVFERSPGGLLMMLLLAIIGPGVELLLINWLHLYEYTTPDVAGIPTWIPWVYAAGGPPNGALGRQFLHEFSKGVND